jgi:hypothetical protein
MGRRLAAALIEAGAHAITHDSVFPEQDTRDEVWLARAGAQGWVVITKDKPTRKRPIAREAMLAAGVRTFIFSGGELNGVEMAASIVAALPRMRRMIAKTPPPFIARITASGDVTLIER